MSGRKIFTVVFGLAVVLSVVTLVSAELPKDPEKVAVEGNDNPRWDRSGTAVRQLDAAVESGEARSRALGTIIYDDGVVTAAPAISSYCFGNHFNTANGSPVNASGSITQLSFFIVSGAGTDNVFVSFYSEPAGTVAPFIEDFSVPLNNGSSAFNTATVSPQVYTGPGFLAGVWYVAGDTVGLGAGTVNGQGHHGMAINDIVGTDYQTLPGLNALVGATGDVLVPVELMSLSVE